MYRPTSWRATVSSLPTITTAAPRRAGRRFASSFAARTSARATGTLVRWGLAGAAVYYYNTSNVFADEPRYAAQPLSDGTESEPYSSIDTIAEQRRAQAKKSSTAATVTADSNAPAIDSPEGLEQEAQQQGAFNEETGEINWDCPCLGGMADGPCGEQFKAAFSCFVFSKEEPKGIDCIEHFKTMQNCFREHPDIYGAELVDDDEEAGIDAEAPQPGAQHAVDVAREKINDTVERTANAISADVSEATQAVRDASNDKLTLHPADTPAPRSPTQKKLSTGGADSEGELVPKAWHDSTEDNGKSISKTQK